jgi:hypothetical protein
VVQRVDLDVRQAEEDCDVAPERRLGMTWQVTKRTDARRHAVRVRNCNQSGIETVVIGVWHPTLTHPVRASVRLPRPSRFLHRLVVRERPGPTSWLDVADRH